MMKSLHTIHIRHTGLLWFLLAYLLLAALATAQGDYPLPPPPSAQPAVDIAMLTLLDGQQRSHPVIPTFDAGQPAEQRAKTTEEVDAVLDSLRTKSSMQDTLQQILISQLREQLPEGGQDMVFDHVMMPGDIELNDEGWMANFEFRMPRTGVGRATYVGRIVNSYGETLRQITGSLLIDREVQALQAIRLLRRGDRIGSGDVRVVTARLSQLPRGVMDEPEMAIGTEVQSEIRPGSWLEQRSVRRPELVKRNQAVTIELNRGMIRITAPGIAREGGTEGQVIKVANAQSGREVYAKIAGPDTVHVLY